MDAITQTKKHKKAIRVLKLIKKLEYRIESNDVLSYEPDADYHWCIDRIEIDTKIKERLQNYYNNNFKI